MARTLKQDAVAARRARAALNVPQEAILSVYALSRAAAEGDDGVDDPVPYAQAIAAPMIAAKLRQEADALEKPFDPTGAWYPAIAYAATHLRAAADELDPFGVMS